jgi:hypothetical protein
MTSWIPRFARVPTELSSEPWAGLLWEPTANVMITRKENQNTTTFLLLYMLGFELKKIRMNEKKLIGRLASALNRQASEVRLPSKLG